MKPLKFEVVSGKVHVTDPCYVKGTWCAGWDVKAKNGVWLAKVKAYTYKDWGLRIKHLYAFHELEMKMPICDADICEIGVDSGQAGIFCSSIYPNSQENTGEFRDPNSFYGNASQQTLNDPGYGTVFGRGICTSSGFGDGSYLVHCKKNKDKEVVAITIRFI